MSGLIVGTGLTVLFPFAAVGIPLMITSGAVLLAANAEVSVIGSGNQKAKNLLATALGYENWREAKGQIKKISNELGEKRTSTKDLYRPLEAYLRDTAREQGGGFDIQASCRDFAESEKAGYLQKYLSNQSQAELSARESRRSGSELSSTVSESSQNQGLHSTRSFRSSLEAERRSGENQQQGM